MFKLFYYNALVVAFSGKAVSVTPEDFTGTWNGRQIFFGYGGTPWDTEITLEISCINGRLAVHGDVINSHQNPNVPSNLHINGEASEIMQKGNELTLTIPYYWATKPVEKRVNSQNVMRYTLTFSDGTIDGLGVQISGTVAKQFYIKLNRTGGMISCVITPPSAG